MKLFLNDLYKHFKMYDPFFILFYDDGFNTQQKTIMNSYKSGGSTLHTILPDEQEIQLYRQIKKYYFQVFAKSEGRANSENKYDFPPPIDTKLFFGSCAIIAFIKNTTGSKTYVDLSVPLWNKMYEKLFGGFEDLTATAAEDENEEDELANVPKEKKTKHGYLKDGFVVDSSDTEDLDSASTEDEDDDDDEDDNGSSDDADPECDVVIEDLGSELSDDSYDYESDNK
jgi:hypothetical protein